MSGVSPFRLWVDGQCLQTASRMRGIGRYVTELLSSIATNHPEVELSISFNAAMAEEALLAREVVQDFIDPANIHMWHGLAKTGEVVDGYTPERRLSELSIAHHVNCLAPDVALSASPFEGSLDQSVPLLPWPLSTVPIASIFYDAIPYRFKRQYFASAATMRCFERRLEAYSRFSTNLCISRFSEAELTELSSQPKTVEISAGISRDFISLARKSRKATDISEDFVLYVGGLDWRKNLTAVIAAFNQLQNPAARSANLVVVGDAPEIPIESIKYEWAARGLRPDRLVIRGHVTDAELIELYKSTRLLVQPSFMEGFGLTALEAIYCGTPVLAANAGALPEIVDDPDYLFAPDNPEELAQKIDYVFDNYRGVKDRFAAIRKRTSVFTWQRTADRTVEGLRALASGKHNRPDAHTARLSVLEEARAIPLDGGLMARALALAEPARGPGRRLLVDVTSTAEVDHGSGIQRVVKNICAALEEAPDREASRLFVVCDDDDGWFATDAQALAIPSKKPAAHVVPADDVLLMLDSSWHHYALHGNYLRACRLRGGEVISCLYDVVPIADAAFCHPGMPPVFSRWFRSALTYSTGFVCISRAVADELLAYLEAIQFPRPIKVGYWQLGADFALKQSDIKQSKPDKISIRSSFLMVGTIEPRKGHRVALEAFETLWADGVDAELLIVGKIGWGIDHLVSRLRAHPEFGKRLIWREKVDDTELASLYTRADALIAASFAEGFGLPIVEAGYFGKPVLASDIPVFREVGKGAAAAQFFEVGNSAALAGAVSNFLKNPPAARHRKSSWPNWSESARQLEEVVLGQKWYRTYQPQSAKPFTPLDALGRTTITTALKDEGRAHRIELVEGPYDAERGARKIIVAVTNLSDEVWSSHGKDDGVFAVALSFHLLNVDLADAGYENARTAIPFVHPPGQTLYLSVMVPPGAVRRGAAYVDIELVQEGVGWFGNPLRVRL